MNRQEIQLLQFVRSMPSVTITMPTHRASPDSKQDPIRLKNLVVEATNRLLKDFSKRELEPLLTRLDALASDLDHDYNLDGLALFVNRDFARAYKTPFPLEETIIIDETFATRDLVLAMNRTSRYWVLALAEKPTRLFQATRDTLVEVTEGGFPMTPDEPSRKAMARRKQRSERVGDIDTGHEKFFRQVDQAFDHFARLERLPLVIVGVERHLAWFRQVFRHAGSIIAAIKGNHDTTSAHDLGRLIWPEVDAALAERRRQLLDELEAAVGAHKCASGVGEVWRYAHEGRGDLLLVEESYHVPATIDDSGLRLSVSDEPERLDVLDDAVDDVIETVLKMDGRVVFMPPGSLDRHQRIALILRY
jgi:hypothetical protein